MKHTIGIDPGLDGGLALINSNGELIYKAVMPTIDTIKRRELHVQGVLGFLEAIQAAVPWSNFHAFLEAAHAMPDQSAQSGFNYGKGFGIIIGILATTGIPYTLVTPQRWQKAMFADVPHGDTKKVAALVCSRLWPKMDFRATERSKISHDGICDAALIAEYGRRSLA